MDPLHHHRVSEIRARLLSHYDLGGRDLPWRESSDAYRVLVSEVMLQQTRVETVLPYYRRWMERFPDLGTLAEAEVEEVLQEWKGLGYYTRARNLHRAAQVVRERYQGRIPGTPEELRELPGVGEYTAGAVASISFGVPTPAVDGNVRRVLSRLFDIEKPTGAVLRRFAEALVDPARPGDFNQAVMELGAAICTPRQPSCADCPLETLCVAIARGTVGERPPRRESRTVPEREMGVVVCVREPGAGSPQLLLRRRPEEGLLGGMWEFPGETLRDGEGPEDGALRCLGGLGLADPGVDPKSLTPVRHTFSHLKVTYHPFLFVTEGVEEGGGARWIPLSRLDDFPLSAAQMRIAEQVRDALSEATPPEAPPTDLPGWPAGPESHTRPE